MLTVLLHQPQWVIQSFSKDFDMTVPALLQTIGYNIFFLKNPLQDKTFILLVLLVVEMLKKYQEFGWMSPK